MALSLSASVSGAAATSNSRTYTTHAGGSVTSGRLLMSLMSWVSQPGTVTPPTGWTLLSELKTGNTAAELRYKISDGTEDAVAWSWVNSTAHTLVILEYNDSVAVLDDSAEDESNASTAVTSQGTGTATATQSSGRAIAIFTADSGRNVDGTRAYSDSFVEDVGAFSGASDRGGVFVASKAISATGDYSCTYSCTDTGDEMYGAIALFTPAASGGVGPIIGGRLLTGLVKGGRLVR